MTIPNFRNDCTTDAVKAMELEGLYMELEDTKTQLYRCQQFLLIVAPLLRSYEGYSNEMLAGKAMALAIETKKGSK